MKAVALLLLAMAIGIVGCNKPSTVPLGTSKPSTGPSPQAGQTNTVTQSPPTPHAYLDVAQPKLQTMKLWLGAEELATEIATNEVQIFTGMMHRTSMGENEGMLFVFPFPHRAAFYMRNTKVALSAAYIDPEGIIREVVNLQPLDETPIEAKTDQVQYVLEVPQGWFERHHVSPGTLVRTELGSLQETFPIRRR